MKRIWKKINWIILTAAGSAIFALGFSLFLEPNDINTGGISGLAQTLAHLLGIQNVGVLSIALNVPLFLVGGFRVGKRFFAGSLLGALVSGIYGGVLCGLGIGIVFVAGTSTGGSDIVVRLLKQRYRNVPIGIISTAFDACVVILTGIVFRDISRALFSGVVVFITGRVMDVVVYRFDYSKVAIIISDRAEEIAKDICNKLDRGATFLHGQGSYSRQEKQVVLTVVKKRQLAELKELVMEQDEDAFVIVQEAHQVLGDGFSRYSKDAL